MKKSFYKKFLDKMERCVQLEQRAERELYFQELKHLTGQQRQEIGRALLNLQKKKLGRSLGGRWLWRFFKKGSEPLPDHQIKVGDLVLCSDGKPRLLSGPVGTVTEVTKYFLTVAFEEDVHSLPGNPFCRLDLISNEVTFKRMLHAIEKLRKGKGKTQLLRNILFGYSKPRCGVGKEEIKWWNERLNEYQKEAVRRCLSSQAFHLIHGPFGTGKTTTCVELILQLVQKGEKVLACADSNTAVDNLVEGLSAYPHLKIVRLGHPARVSPFLLSFSLDYQVENHPDYPEVKKLRNEKASLKEEQKKYESPTPSRRRGMTDKEIQRYARKGMGVRGLSSQQIHSLSRWIALQHRIDFLNKKTYELETRIIQEILSFADVVCATNTTAGVEWLDSLHFDSVIVDEATQATEPSCYIPLLRGNRFFLAGDHKQLPPTILSFDAQKEGLGYTLFERLLDLYAHFPISSLLQEQYRMNETLAAFPSQTFYEGKVYTAKSVQGIYLRDLLIKTPRRGTPLERAILNDVPIIFLDTHGVFPEFQSPGSTSRENIAEAQVLLECTQYLVNYGVFPRQIGIIAPYKDQVEWMRLHSPPDGVEIHTVDGFQGREKEVILLSFVRSNPEQDIGFLADPRRLNVSLTRAKRKLIMVGDAQTLCSSPLFVSMINFVREKGIVLSLEKEWLKSTV
ncbi:MAG: IGHMBP2 family helicase [bacterium JZ-2024 1]